MAGSAHQKHKISHVAAAATPNQLPDDEPSPAPTSLGQGCVKVSGAGLNTAVTTNLPGKQAMSEVHYSVCKSITEVLQAFEVEQSLAVGLVGIGSASEKVSFVQSQKVTSTSVTVAIYAKHLSKESVSDATLKNDIQPPINSNQALYEFFLEYGDCYLSSRTVGGEYCALYLYSTETIEEQSKLVTDLQAGGIDGGGSVETRLQDKLNQFNSTTTVQFTFDQSITGLVNPDFPSPEKMIDYALAFPSNTLDGPIVTSFATTGYEHLPGITGDFQPIKRNRVLIAEDPAFIGRLGQLVELQNAIASINTFYSFYGGYDEDAHLKRVGGQADEDKQAVLDMVKKYTDDPLPEVVLPKLTSIDEGIPDFQFEDGESQVLGVPGGQNAFDDVPAVRDYLLNRTRITEIQLAPGGVINQFITTYSDGVSHKHGGGGGDFMPPANLDEGTFVKSVGGDVRRVNQNTQSIGTLHIMLSDGREVPGGRDYITDKPFEWTVPKNSFVVGFRGKSGWYLDQLRIVYVTFKPARWTKPS